MTVQEQREAAIVLKRILDSTKTESEIRKEVEDLTTEQKQNFLCLLKAALEYANVYQEN